jgi:phospholipase B1
LIGANDVCNSCNFPVSADTYEQKAREVLDNLRRNIPNLVVNFPLLSNVSQLWDLTKDSAFCDRQRASQVTVECTCAFLSGTNGATKRRNMDDLTAQYNKRIYKLRDEFNNLGLKSFMVVADPSSTGFALKELSLEYLSTFDCFHPSLKAHSMFATGSWNNLFKPNAEKRSRYPPSSDIECPTADSRIQP